MAMDTITTSHGGPLQLQPSSVLGLRSAIMAVLRQCALQSLVEILSLHQGHRVRLALKSWLNSVRQVQLHQHHARTAAEASRASDRLAEKHEGNVAQLRKEWKHARQAMMQSQQHEMNDDELQKLRDLDKRYRRQMAEMHDSHEELQGEHRSAHKEAQTMCKKNIKVLAMGVLESLATRHRTGTTGRGDDGPQGDSPSVCFMQWAFTQNPEAWCPLPPARDLKHAMVLSEQRSQLAFSLRQLQETLQGLPQALRAAAAQRHPGGDHREELIPKQTAVAARLLRRALQNILWKRLGCFLHRLIGLRPLPRSSHRGAGAGAQSGAHRAGRRSVARQGAHAQRSSAFFLGEDFGDIQRSPPTTAHELHGTQSLRDAKASKTAHPKMQTEDAALKIQSVERGRRARKSMKLQMQATMSPPVASERPTAASVHGAVVEQPPPSHPSHLPALPPVPLKVQEAAATKIQAHLRGRIGRKVVAQKKKVFSRRSALKLIAAKPGPSGPSGPSSPAPQVTDAEKRGPPSKAAAVPRMRRSVAKRPDSALEDEPSPEEASMGHLPPPPEVLHAAAVKIQSAARGHQGRQKAAALAAAERRQQAPEHRATEEAEDAEEAEEEDLESDEDYEARRVTHLGPALTE